MNRVTGPSLAIFSVLVLGFLLGMRHATDADHVVAVSAIVSRERTLRAAAPIGVLWGLGHTLTILLVGGGMILFGVVIPPRDGLGMRFCVAVMLVGLGGFNLITFLSRFAALRQRFGMHHDHDHDPEPSRAPRSMRPLFVGVVHGLAGSAAIVLLVLGTIRNALWALSYLVVFGVGTLAGMLLITLAIAAPFAMTARRFQRMHGTLAIGTGVASVALGVTLVYQIGIVQGLFSSAPHWTPQ